MKAAIGQDSHRFEEGYGKPLILGGVVFPGETGLLANSDGDVVLHAITNAVSGITGRNILGRVADEMCQSGITDSAEYLREALKSLEGRIVHLSISMECLRPKISPMILRWQMKSVRKAAAANAYLTGALKLTQNSDIFTHRTETRRKIERHSSSSSSHAESGGGGTGRSGKF